MVDEEESLFVEGPGEFYYGDEEEESHTNQGQESEAPSDEKLAPAPAAAPPITYPHAIKPKKSVTLTLPLHFQHRIINDVLSEDGLLIVSRGLGLPSIVANLLFQLDVAGTDPQDAENSLVLVVNADSRESEQLREEMRQISVVDSVNDDSEELLGPSRAHRGLSVITDKVQQAGRKEAYLQGGVYAVTSRILVRDMLSEDIIDRKKITAIVVLNAHRVGEYSAISFILRLFREVNKAGTIKAVSDQPERFAGGFSPLTTHMKFLRLNKTWLWPRFHIKVKQELLEKTDKNGNNSVHEVMVEPTESMREISQHIRACMQSKISELKRLNPKLDTEAWTIDAAYHERFIGMIRSQMNPIWHRVSWDSKNIIYDLASLRELLDKSTRLDCVSFLKDVVFTYNNGELAARRNHSSWVLLDDAQYLLRVATERVFGSYELSKEQREVVGIEQMPKWDQLSRILQEIGEDDGPILIKCTKPRQLIDYLKNVKNDGDVFSAQDYLKSKRTAYKEWRKSLPSAETMFNRGESSASLHGRSNKRNTTSAPSAHQMQNRGFSKRRRVRGGKSDSPSTRPIPITPTEVIDVTTESENLSETTPATEDTPNTLLMEEEEDNEEEPVIFGQVENGVVDMEQMVMIEDYDEDIDPIRLRELRPKHIILYEPSQSFVRNIEIYRATHSDQSIKVYFMVYKDSVEESKFLTDVRREKDSFTKLIREKSQMPKIIHDDELDDPAANTFLRTISTRRAGGQITAVSERPRVLVDSREFTDASHLPFLLHMNKIQVVPVTLNVGDYIVTDQICVERKTVSDLVQSFENGRLYDQCAKMFKYYEIPVLLIEFDQAKSFSMEPFSEERRSKDSAKLAQEQVQQNLSLLLLHYPKLRIIWSMSPDHAAKILVDLKMDRAEPDIEASRLYGSEEPGAIENADLENETAIRMIQAIPGVNYRNYTDIVNNVPNIGTLCQMTEDEIAEVIGKEAAKKVYQFINRRV